MAKVSENIPLKSMLESQGTSSKLPSIWASSGKQLLILGILYVSNFVTCSCFALLTPLYPRVAEEKGMPSAVTGWVFGIFALVQFLFAPIAGRLCNTIGTRFVLMAGTFFAGGCTILFGFVDKMSITGDGNTVFTVFSFLIRIFLGIGCTSSLTAALAIGSYTFPDNVPTALSILESAVGLGLMLGPALSGLIYERGGFLAPFAGVGVTMMVPLPFYRWLLKETYEENGETQEGPSVISLLRVPAISCMLISVVVTAIVIISLDPILEPHLRKFGLSPSQVGLVFFIMSGAYCIMTPAAGRMTELLEDGAPLMVIGHVVTIIGLLLLGPSPLIGLHWYNHLWLTVVSLAIIGIGCSLAVVPTFGKILEYAQNIQPIGAQTTVAGVWTAAYALGDFIGPIYTGAVYKVIGFGWTMTSIVLLPFVMIFVITFLYLFERGVSFCCRDSSERLIN